MRLVVERLVGLVPNKSGCAGGVAPAHQAEGAHPGRPGGTPPGSQAKASTAQTVTFRGGKRRAGR